MSYAIDFIELKQRVNIEQAADMLGIKLKKKRAATARHVPDLQIGRRPGIRHHARQGPLLLLRHVQQRRRRHHHGGECSWMFTARGGRVLKWQERRELVTGKE